jgi:hypothetical protein
MKRYRVHAMAGSNATDLEALLAEGTKEHDVNLRDRFAFPPRFLAFGTLKLCRRNRTTPLHHAVYYNKIK